MPIAHKDIFCTDGIRTTCGSRMLGNFVAPYDATVVARWRSAGTVLLGKTNMDEFAMGSSNETSFFGPVRNPWDPARVPGGSSGGSAAAVAARLAPAASGTDTGGSIRQPAALTNLTGLKPTYGRVSRYGMIAFASSLDQAGVLARSAEDAALLLGAMAGFDPRDSTSVDSPVPDYARRARRSRSRVCGSACSASSSTRVSTRAWASSCGRRSARCEERGASVREVSLPTCPCRCRPITSWLRRSVPPTSRGSTACGSVIAARTPRDLLDLYERSRGEGFGDEVKRRIMTGTYVLSAGYYDAYYLKAQKVRQLIADDFARAFAEVDVVIGPTTPTAAFELGAKTSDPITMYLNDIYTIGANLAGLPAVSIPCGFVREGDRELPVGLQLIGPHFGEARLLGVAHQYQRATDWHRRMPPGYE